MKWINPKIELPEKGTRVLVYMDESHCSLLSFTISEARLCDFTVSLDCVEVLWFIGSEYYTMSLVKGWTPLPEFQQIGNGVGEDEIENRWEILDL